MNVAAMVRWLHGLRELPQYADQSRPVDLIRDTLSAHGYQEVRDVARSLDIVTHFIPAGATGTMQPLDRYLFGAMKPSQANPPRQSGRGRLAEAEQEGLHPGPAGLTGGREPATLARAWEIYETQ
jgi:hypothetical protein